MCLAEEALRLGWTNFTKEAISRHKLAETKDPVSGKKLYKIEPLVNFNALSHYGLGINMKSMEEYIILFIKAKYLTVDVEKEYGLKSDEMIHDKTVVHIHEYTSVYERFLFDIEMDIRLGQTGFIEKIFKLERPPLRLSYRLLHSAVAPKNEEMVNILLKYVDIPPADFRKILFDGIATKQVQIVANLLEKKPSDLSLATSLVYASGVASVEIIKLLELHGAVINHSINPPFEMAVVRRRNEITRFYLERGFKLENISKAALLNGIQTKDAEFAKTLLENNLLGVLTLKEVALALCRANSKKMLVYLSSSKYNGRNGVNLDSFHEDILELAFNSSLDSVLSFMFQRGLKASEIPTELLKTGFEIGSLLFVKTMLSHGVDLHFENDYPLFAVCNFKSENRKGVICLKFFLQSGADVYAKNSAALRAAIINGNADYVNLIFKYSKKKHKGLEDAVLGAFCGQNHRLVKSIVDNKDLISIKANRIFYKLCLGPHKKRFVSFITQFLEFKVNINYKGRKLINTLISEKSKRNTEVLKLLIDKGITIDTKNEDILLNAIKFNNMVVINRVVEIGIYHKKVLESGLSAAKKGGKATIYNVLKNHQLKIKAV